MSATPRPWSASPDCGCCIVDARIAHAPLLIVSAHPAGLYHEDRDFILRAVNAFDALLALAREADRREDADLSEGRNLSKALVDLDAAHPDWRTW